jgi:CRP-like cAMP-binding protein
VASNNVVVDQSPGTARRPTCTVLAGSHWLEHVSPDALTHLGARWVVKHVSPGAVLMQAGVPALGVCFLLRGTLRVQVAVGSPTPATLALVCPGEIVGEMAVLDGAGCAAEVSAVELCEVAWIDRETFLDAMERWPSLTRGVAHLLSRRLRQTDQAVHALVAMEVDQRVAQRLLDFASTYGEALGERGIRLPMRVTQQDLAALVGASRERTNRALVAFKRRGWISMDAQLRMTLLRPDLLTRRAQGPGPQDHADL